jgi:hypothetical protein
LLAAKHQRIERQHQTICHLRRELRERMNVGEESWP